MTSLSIRIPLLAFSLIFALSACASGSSGESSTRTDPNVLTSEEMAVVPGSNLLEVVDRLRPRWLQTRGQGEVIVYMNRSYLGGVQELRQYEPANVTRLQYYDGPRAAALLTGYPSTMQIAGAIVMETSPGGE